MDPYEDRDYNFVNANYDFRTYFHIPYPTNGWYRAVDRLLFDKAMKNKPGIHLVVNHRIFRLLKLYVRDFMRDNGCLNYIFYYDTDDDFVAGSYENNSWVEQVVWKTY